MYKLIILLFMLGTNFSDTETFKSVELWYQTRGTQKHLQFTADSIFVKINGKTANYKTSSPQWKMILKPLRNVKLSSISTLKRPRTKSYYDSAMITQLKVITNAKAYESVNFDHDIPPTILVKTINAIKLTLSKTENKRDF